MTRDESLVTSFSPATSELAYQVACFWKGAIQNLEKEMAVHEILCSNEHLEHAGEGLEVIG